MPLSSSQRNVVLFIDDQITQVTPFMEQLGTRRLPWSASPLEPIHIPLVDEALDYLSEFRPEIVACVLDMKMDPGVAFADGNNAENQIVGELLFMEIEKLQSRFNQHRGGLPLPISFLTNFADYHESVREVFISKRPKEAHLFEFWPKHGPEMVGWGELFVEWMKGLRELYNIK